MPTMVRIHISNSEATAAGDKVEEEEFSVPRGLICAHSAYFDTVFRKQYAESDTGRSVIDDVRPWAFRVFVGWLYFQRICYVGDRVEPIAFKGPAATGHMVEQSGLEVSSMEMSADNTELSTADLTTLDETRTDSRNLQGIRSTRRRHQLESNSSRVRRNDDDPMTWDWQDLFELYVLGEKVSFTE